MSRAAELEKSRVFAPERVLLPDISYKAFTYPGDEEALDALKSVPGAGTLLSYLQENFTEQLIFLKNNEQMLRAGQSSYPSLHKLVARCAEILSCPMPELYITKANSMNAYTVGHRRTCIVLHSELVESLTADELAFVIGHEIGHIKCAHGLYRQLGDILVRYWDAVASMIPVPGIGLIRIPLLIAFWEWYRRAEFTCDRAGLLCVQDVNAATSALAKLSGQVAGLEQEIDIDSAINQLESHKEVNKLVLVVSILDNAENTHPFVPKRLKQIREYAATEAYTRILSGDYARDLLGEHEAGARVSCRCGTKVNSKLAFCPSCGADLRAATELPAALVCAGCQRPVTPDTKFCPGCGAQQPQAQAAAAASGSGLDRFKSLKDSAAGFLKR